MTYKTKYQDFASVEEAISNITLEQGDTVLFTANKTMYIMYLENDNTKVVRDITKGVTDFNETMTGRGELFFCTCSQAEYDALEEVDKKPNVIYLILSSPDDVVVGG